MSNDSKKHGRLYYSWHPVKQKIRHNDLYFHGILFCYFFVCLNLRLHCGFTTSWKGCSDGRRKWGEKRLCSSLDWSCAVLGRWSVGVQQQQKHVVVFTILDTYSGTINGAQWSAFSRYFILLLWCVFKSASSPWFYNVVKKPLRWKAEVGRKSSVL